MVEYLKDFNQSNCYDDLFLFGILIKTFFPLGNYEIPLKSHMPETTTYQQSEVFFFSSKKKQLKPNFSRSVAISYIVFHLIIPPGLHEL